MSVAPARRRPALPGPSPRATLRWLALAGACAGTLAPGAQAATRASLHPSFTPNRLGGAGALTVSLRLAGGGEGPESVPPPLRTVVIHLPAGLGVSLRGVGTCSHTRLQARGAGACPASSLVGRGRALAEFHPASITIAEQTTLTAFRAPDRGGRPALAILSQGLTPLDQRAVIGGVLEPDTSPYGSKLVLSVPAVPTLLGEPDASTASMSLTIGRTGGAAGPVIAEPLRCAHGGFPFAANLIFADASTAAASASAPCP